MTTESVSRLQAWIRDHGPEKEPVFIADLSAVLESHAALLEACELVADWLDTFDVPADEDGAEHWIPTLRAAIAQAQGE